MSHLNGQKVFGKVMRVTLSKHQTVALPREGLDDQLLTKGLYVCRCGARQWKALKNVSAQLDFYDYFFYQTQFDLSKSINSDTN